MPEHHQLSPEALVKVLHAAEYTRLMQEIGKAQGRPGTHIAVIGDLCSGRDHLVRQCARDFAGNASSITLNSPVRAFSASGILDAREPLVFIEGAHHLFTRTVGGFESLRAFIAFVAATDKTTISSWNIHAWKYASAVEALDRNCSVVLTVPPIPMEGLRDGILASYNGEIRCINDATVARSVLVSPVTHAVRIPVFRNEVKIPGISVDWNLLLSAVLRRRQTESPEQAVFSRLEKFSRGNMGIALHLWNRYLDYPEIRVSRIHDAAALPDLSDLTIDDRFLLATLLMMESADIHTLPEIIGDPSAGSRLFSLKEKHLVEEYGSLVRIRPEVLVPVSDHLVAMRMVA